MNAGRCRDASRIVAIVVDGVDVCLGYMGFDCTCYLLIIEANGWRERCTLSRCEGDECGQILRTVRARSVLSALGSSVHHDYENYELTEIGRDALFMSCPTEQIAHERGTSHSGT